MKAPGEAVKHRVEQQSVFRDSETGSRDCRLDHGVKLDTTQQHGPLVGCAIEPYRSKQSGNRDKGNHNSADGPNLCKLLPRRFRTFCIGGSG